MKVTEFLEKLWKTPRNWYLSGPNIRNKAHRCPLEEVAGTGRRSSSYAGTKLGLSPRTSNRIITGADVPAPTLWRKRLLKACGLDSDGV